MVNFERNKIGSKGDRFQVEQTVGERKTPEKGFNT